MAKIEFLKGHTKLLLAIQKNNHTIYFYDIEESCFRGRLKLLILDLEMQRTVGIDFIGLESDEVLIITFEKHIRQKLDVDYLDSEE